MGWPSFRLHRAERGHTIKRSRIPKQPKNMRLLLPRSLALEAEAHMYWGWRNLHILHHRMQRLQESIDSQLNVVSRSPCHFVTVHHYLEVQETLAEPEQVQDSQDQHGSEDRREI